MSESSVQKIYFISDLHIKSMNEEKAQVLLRFLRSISSEADKTVLFFLGDIFDLWLGDHKYFKDRFRPLINEIESFISAGGEFHYFEGNHDLHLKSFWEKQVGGVVHSNPELFSFQGLKIRAEHGDQMNPDDKGYLFLRWLLRTWFFRCLILNLPGIVVSWVGERASGISRDYTDGQRDEEKILSIIHKHAELMSKNQEFDTILSGHVHLRDEYSFMNKGKKVTSYNLGSWDRESFALLLFEGQWSWEQLRS